MRQTLLFILLTAILANGACIAQTEETKPTTEIKSKGMSCFYASHSLMWDMPPVLTELAEAYGIEGHKVLGIQRLGVSRTSQHWDLQDNQNQAKQILKEGNLDAFIMSPIGMPDPGIDNFVKLGLEHNPNMKFYIQISWPGMGLVDNDDMESMMGGGRRGPIASGTTPGGAPITQTAAAPGGTGGRGGRGGGMMGGMMDGAQDYNKTPEEIAKINIKNNKSAEDQAKRINEEVGKTVVYLIPTAQAHNALRTMIYNEEMPGMTDQGEVFRDFIGHPTVPVVALNAYLHFAVLYQHSPVGLLQPEIFINPPAEIRAGWKDEWKNPELNTKLQELAWKTVINYPQSGVKAPAEEKK